MACEVCGSPVSRVYEAHNQPLGRYGMQLSLEAAVGIKRGYDIAIDECVLCGFASNSLFVPSSVNYDALPVLESAGFSAGYRELQLRTADRINAYFAGSLDRVIEIGGGDGYFISKISASQKIVYEPALEGKEVPSGIECVPDYFRPGNHELHADLVVMRQVLEHINSPVDFIQRLVKSTIRTSTAEAFYLYIEVPSHEQTQKGSRFCDFYYEHCNYFTTVSLALLAKRTGGQVSFHESLWNNEILSVMIMYPYEFNGGKASYDLASQRLSEILLKSKDMGRTTAVWGLSGNGITLLNTLGADRAIVPVVIDSDIRKQGLYVPVTGQRVFSPEEAINEDIDVIVIASQFHSKEIADRCRLDFPGVELYSAYGDRL